MLEKCEFLVRKSSLKPGWRMVKFGDIADNINVRVDPAKAETDIYVGLEHLDPESLHLRRWGHPSDVTGQKMRFQKGDVVFGRRRAYQRKLAVAEFDGICSAHAMVVRAKPNVILPEFLPFFMQSDMFMERAIEISVGSLSPTINWKTMKVQEFPIPPIKEQRRIAEILWAADTCSQKYLNVSDSLSIVRTALVNKEIQKKNLAVPLGDLIIVGPQNGLYRPATDYGKGAPILRIDSFYDGVVNTELELKRVNIGASNIERYKLTHRDIVINRVNSREYLGKCGLVPDFKEDTVFESNIMKFSIDESLALPEYIVMILTSSATKKYILSRCKDAINQSSINQDDVKSIKIPLPDIEKQRLLVSVDVMIREQILDISGFSRKTLEKFKRAFKSSHRKRQSHV
ncbi:MAG: restriction endonuclease subunit S [Magnetococcales bacterium]|nr:restriction endonuclease subunit S [Magnetococcales bacterium]